MFEWLRVIASRIHGFLTTRRLDQDFEQELEAHLALLTEENMRRGLTPQNARREARLRLGGVTQLRETHRELQGLPWIETFFQDLRYAFRVLRKNPAFTAVAVLTLALGIGANTAIFSVVYAVLLKPLPYANPDQLVIVFEEKLAEGITKNGSSYLDFVERREQNRSFRELAGTQAHDLTLTGRGEPSVVDTAVVTPELFSILGVRPLAGRTFVPEDGVKGASPVVILSENFWSSRFGADPKIVGSPITLDKRSFTVIGIMPAAFRSPPLTRNQDVWIPLVDDPLFSGWMAQRGEHWLGVLGRLNPGVSLSQAQAEMNTIQARLVREYPAEDAGRTIRVVPLGTEIVGNVKSALLVLLGAVGLVLLIACANVANLLLARATSRANEVAVRMALGAGQTRMVRQLLTESAALGWLGGLAGIGLACFGVQGLRSLLPPDLPQVHSIRVDGWVLGFALFLSVAASFGFGLAPALFAVRSSLQASLKEGTGRAGEGGGRQRARGFLAIAEIALAMVLLVGAGLLLRSFATLTSVNPGFEVRQIVKADVSLPRFEYSTPQQWTQFENQLLARIQAQPGLRDSAVAVPLPLGQGCVVLGFDLVGGPPLPPGTTRRADYVSVSPDYFHVMGIPLLRGRSFSVRDSPSSPRVALVSEALAQRYFPNQDPLGRKLIFGFPPDRDVRREIVGIVGDVRATALSQDPEPTMYVPFAQSPFWGGELVVKTSLSLSSVAAAIRHEVRNIDPDLPVTDIEPISGMVNASVAQPRFRAFLLGLFAALALILAAAGIFGVVSYSVSRRTREIGIRIALGASPSRVLWMMLAESGKLVLLGLAFGIPAALVLARFLSGLLFAVHSTDPLTFVGVIILLSLVALAASYVPTRRAVRADPMVALRCE